MDFNSKPNKTTSLEQLDLRSKKLLKNDSGTKESSKRLSNTYLTRKERGGTSMKKTSIVSENETEIHYMKPVETVPFKAQINYKQESRLQNQTFDNAYMSTETVNYKLGQNDVPQVEKRRSSLTYNQKFQFFTQPLGPGHYDPKIEITRPHNKGSKWH